MIITKTKCKTMNKNCIYYDDCEVKADSACCGATIVASDICSDCGEHTSDSCEGCEIVEYDDIPE